MGFQAEPNEDTQIYIKVSSSHLPPLSQRSYVPGLEDVKSTTKYFFKCFCMTGRQTSRENQLLNPLHSIMHGVKMKEHVSISKHRNKIGIVC